jgi:hypothetical protein
MKVYYRDQSKVMRAIPGIIMHGKTIFIDKSVYTLSRTDAYDWMFVVKEE